MVSTPRRRASLAALLLAILLALPALPLPVSVAPDAEAQTQTQQPQLAVDEWGVSLTQSGRVGTHFLTNGSFTLSVPILNKGSAFQPGTAGIPAFAWFEPVVWNDAGSNT